jgi:hypothetical protein
MSVLAAKHRVISWNFMNFADRVTASDLRRVAGKKRDNKNVARIVAIDIRADLLESGITGDDN